MKTLSLALALTLTSCATGYQPEGLTGGFSEIPLSQTAYKITVSGNGFTSGSKVQEMGLLRAAELSKMNGYDYFVLQDMNSWTTSSSYTSQGSSTTTTTGSATAYGYGNTVRAYGQSNSQTTYSAPQTTTYFKPNVAIVVQFLNEEEAEASNALSVEQVYNLYAVKYGLADDIN